MDMGVLVERGTHDDLIGQDGVYARLVRLQFADGEAA
jgi:ATP-binding cassette subfamily B protein